MLHRQVPEAEHIPRHNNNKVYSDLFQALFVDNPSPHPIVILKDVTFADLRTMVDFMYYGQVNVTEEQLPQVKFCVIFISIDYNVSLCYLTI